MTLLPARRPVIRPRATGPAARAPLANLIPAASANCFAYAGPACLRYCSWTGAPCPKHALSMATTCKVSCAATAFSTNDAAASADRGGACRLYAALLSSSGAPRCADQQASQTSAGRCSASSFDPDCPEERISIIVQLFVVCSSADMRHVCNTFCYIPTTVQDVRLSLGCHADWISVDAVSNELSR